jgi:hypothetical protein
MPESQTSQNQRREDRIPIESVNLPFLGTRIADMALFQYLLLDISLHGARILLPEWVTKRELLYKDTPIDFHLPFLFEGETFNKGGVAWAKWDTGMAGQVCGVRIDVRAPLYYPIYVSFAGKSITMDLSRQRTPENMLKKILHDTILLKKGILIYLRHINPILPRITGYDDVTLRQLRTFLFQDVRDLVEQNIAELTKYKANIRDGACSHEHIHEVFDMEELLLTMEPELDYAVWGHAFDQEILHQYLAAILSLEKKIFYNYNTLVMIHAHALSNTPDACLDPHAEQHHGIQTTRAARHSGHQNPQR